MANPLHEEKIRQGAAAWNQFVAEQGDDFTADLLGADLANKDLRGANLHGADLRAANLHGTDLRAANLSAANLRAANLHGTDLRAANLSAANLRAADLDETNFGGANLRGAELYSIELHTSNISAADVRTITLSPSSRRSPTDLRSVRGLNQFGLDNMDGDSATLIPDDLDCPSHWPDLEEPTPSHSEESSPQIEPPQSSETRIYQSAVANAETLRLASAYLIEEIDTSLERLRGINDMEPKVKEAIETFLTTHRENTLGLDRSIETLNSEQEPTSEKTEQVASWVKRFTKGAKEGLKALTNPETLGTRAAFAGIVVTTALIGACFGAPLAGAIVGSCLINEKTPAQVIKDALTSSAKNKENEIPETPSG